jgi:hypothetical protein
VEFGGRFNRVLTGHGVGDEEDFDGVEGRLQFAQLAHELFVDVEAAGGVDKDDIFSSLNRLAAGSTRQFQGLRFASDAGVDGQVELLGEDGQLVTGGGTVDVDRHHQRIVLVLGEPAGQLSR